tara:strand:+ start:519 stop:962 length:444 start_codon:yes stop_codon:yes gene_type:complete
MILQDKVKTFCYLGLLPFIFIPILSWVSPKFAFEYELVSIFFWWSISMAFFMAGTLWAFLLSLKQSVFTSVRIFFLIFILLIISQYGLGSHTLGSILLALLFVYEDIYMQEKKLINDIGWYEKIRFHLTFTIRICHLLMIGFIFTNQ